MPDPASWKLNGNSAAVTRVIGGTPLELTINTQSPTGGASLAVGAGSASFFGIDNINDPQQIEPAYQRQQDLILRYHSDDKTFAHEVYWRLLEIDRSSSMSAGESGSEGLFVEMIYSLQTDLLDTRPQPQPRSIFPATDIKTYASHGDVFNASASWAAESNVAQSQLVTAVLPQGQPVAIGVFPSDLSRLVVETNGQQTTIVFDLDAPFLEKGVIRRTRMFACILPPESNEDHLLELATLFLNSEIPLTT